MSEDDYTKRPCHVTLKCDVCGSLLEAYGDTIDHATLALAKVVSEQKWATPRFEFACQLGRDAIVEGALSVKVKSEERDLCARCQEPA